MAILAREEGQSQVGDIALESGISSSARVSAVDRHRGSGGRSMATQVHHSGPHRWQECSCWSAGDDIPGFNCATWSCATGFVWLWPRPVLCSSQQCKTQQRREFNDVWTRHTVSVACIVDGENGSHVSAFRKMRSDTRFNYFLLPHRKTSLYQCIFYSSVG